MEGLGYLGLGLNITKAAAVAMVMLVEMNQL